MRCSSTRLSVNTKMTRERFVFMGRALRAGAGVAIIILLMGCRPHIAQTSWPISNPIDVRFPEPDPESWDASGMPGLQPATCQLTAEETENVLLSFLHGIALAIEQLEPIALKRFSVEACYRTEFQGTVGGGMYRARTIVAIIGDRTAASVGPPNDLVETAAHLVYGNFQVGIGGGLYPRYSFYPVAAAGEMNPLVLVRRNEGASGRFIIYELYRIESDRLKRLWEWSDDSFSDSTTMYYSISNMDFSGLRSIDHKRLTVYTTHGNRRKMDPEDDTDLTPKHRVTSFVWNATADAFVQESRTNQ
jgi:hypothetical protein